MPEIFTSEISGDVPFDVEKREAGAADVNAMRPLRFGQAAGSRQRRAASWLIAAAAMWGRADSFE